MKFIPLHSLNDGQPYRFFLNKDRVMSVYPARGEDAERGYRSIVVTLEQDIAVTDSMATVVKRLNEENKQ